MEEGGRREDPVFDGLITLTAISVFVTAVWMWKVHPLQNVYFNIFAGKNVIARYDLDYWGLANRRALEYILQNDHSPVVTVGSDNAMSPLGYSFLMLKPEDRERVRLGDDKRASDYVVTNHRFDTDIDNAKYRREYELFYEVRVDSELVLSVFKWKGGMSAAESSCAGDKVR